MMKQILPIIILGILIIVVITLIMIFNKKEGYLAGERKGKKRKRGEIEEIKETQEIPGIPGIPISRLERLYQPHPWINSILPFLNLEELIDIRNSSKDAKYVADQYINRLSPGMNAQILSNLIYFVGAAEPLIPMENQVVDISLGIIRNIFNSINQNSAKILQTPTGEKLAVNKSNLPRITITDNDYWSGNRRPLLRFTNIGIFLINNEEEGLPNQLRKIDIFIKRTAFTRSNEPLHILENRLLNLARTANGQFIGNYNNTQKRISAKVFLVGQNYQLRKPDYHPSMKEIYQYTPQDWMGNTQKFQNFKDQGAGILIRFSFSYINMFDANEGFERFFRYAPPSPPPIQPVEEEEEVKQEIRIPLDENDISSLLKIVDGNSIEQISRSLENIVSNSIIRREYLIQIEKIKVLLDSSSRNPIFTDNYLSQAKRIIQQNPQLFHKSFLTRLSVVLDEV